MSGIDFLARRLKQARLKAGLSQKQLGIKAGIDEFSASPRMNQYERNKHLPDMATAVRLAKVLDVPIAFLFCPDDEVADVLIELHRVPKEFFPRIQRYLKKLQLE